MKKATLILLLMLAITFCPLENIFVAEALTETPHIVVSSNEVYLQSLTGEKVFLLPESYYAEINNMDLEYYYVTFNNVSGKVLRTAVTTTSYHTEAKGSTAVLTFSDLSQDFDTISLRSAPDPLSVSVVSMPTSASFTFIGKYPTETSLWYYVRYGMDYGYVKAEHTRELDLIISAFQPETPPVTDVSTGVDDATPDGELSIPFDMGGNVLRILLIVGICIPAVLIVFLIFRPKRSRKSKYHFDD